MVNVFELLWGIPTDYRLITDYAIFWLTSCAMFWLTSLAPPARSAMLDDVIVPQCLRPPAVFLGFFLGFFFSKNCANF